MKNFLFRLAAAFALLFYSGNVLLAADYAQSLAAGQRVLDMYLERARVQTSRERFESLAEQGLSASICEWEQSALDLKLAGLEDWIFCKEEAESALKGRAQDVFSDWVAERKKSEAEEIQKSELYSELKKLANEFFFLDSSGTETRVVSKEEIGEAKKQFQQKAGEILKKYLAASDSESADAQAYLVELQVLNELTNALLYDHDSLKKMSDSQAALFIADKLADQIESESGRAMELLFNSLQSQVDFSSSDDVAAKKEAEENWLLRFENELNLGLKKWSDAEEEFLSARSEWEREAENIYLNDNQKWQEAYDELQNRKIAWGQKIEAQIQAGKEEWRNKLDVLEGEIDQALLEFENALSWESEQKKQIVQSQENAYIQSRDILESSQKGVEVWYERWGPKYKGLYSYWKTEDTFGKSLDLSLVGTAYLKNELSVWKEDFAQSLIDVYGKICKQKYEEKLLEQEKEKAKNKNSHNSNNSNEPVMVELPEYDPEEIWEEYPEMTCSALSSMLEIWQDCVTVFLDKRYVMDVPEEWWQCLRAIPILWDAPNELFEWLDLYDKFKIRANEALYSLYSDSCANIQIVDELSSEKAKASWLVDYWTSRVQIAAAVVDYAQNDFSDLEWADRTEKNLKDALDSYNQAKAAYQEAFALAEEKRSEVLSARQNYFDSLALCQKLLEQIDQERAAYDALYQQKLDIIDSLAQNTTLDLLCQLEALNVSDEDFKKYLWTACFQEQEAYEKELAESVMQLRTVVEDGYEGSPENEDEKNASCLSLARLEELEDSLRELLSAPSLDAQKTQGLFDDLKKLDAASVAAMEQRLLDGEQGGLLDGLEADLERFLSIVQMEAENRRAILLLFDGSAQDIHAFFDQNDGFSELYQKYREYSAALLQEDAKASLKALQKAVSERGDSSLDEYFDALDQAVSEATPFVICAEETYKKLLLCQKDCAALEAAVRAKTNLCETVLGDIQLSAVDWFCDACEEFIMREKDYKVPMDGAAEFLEKVSDGRTGLLLDLQERLDFLLGSASEIDRLDVALIQQGAAVQAAQKNYENSLGAVDSSNKNSSINIYLSACDCYNNFLEGCQAVYERLEAARRDYRLAQEIYFYAQNEYLHGSYDPNENLETCQEALQKAKSALDALNAIEQEKAGRVLDDYKNECLNYYKGRVMLYEYEQRLSGQTQALFEAQEAERAAAQFLASECVPQGYEAQVSPFAKDLVLAVAGPDGSYSFYLNKGLAPLPQENESFLKDYYSNYCVLETDVYQNEYLSTRAQKDALEFLESMQTKPYTLVDLALCALYLKGSGNIFQAAAWYKEGENPAVNDNYKMGYLPDSVQGVNVANVYHDSRLWTLAETYVRVVSLGGEEDIAKYILHCDACFSRTLDFDALTRNALTATSLITPIDYVQSHGDSWAARAAAAFALAAVFSVISGLPFGLGAWAAPIAAGHAATGAVFMCIANQFFQYARDMTSVQYGCMSNVVSWLTEFQTAFANWQNAKRAVEEERIKLNLLISGRSELNGKKITWSDFKRSVQETFDSKSLGVDSSWFMSMHDSSLGQKNLKDFFDELSAQEDFYDARSVIQKMAVVLKKNYADKKDSLEELVASRDGDLTFDKAGYYKDLLSFYSNDLLRNLPAAMNRACEDYLSDALLDYKNLAEEALAYSQKNRFNQKRDLYSFVYADMDEQHCLWEEKNQIILDTAQIEWLEAQEKINLAYNSWQKEFSYDYQSASGEWSKNYKEFLERKEDWLFKQYLSGGGETDVSYPLVKKMRSVFDSQDASQKLLDSICDSDKFSRLAQLAQSLASFAQNDSYCKNFFDKIDVSLIKDYNAALCAQKELQESLTAAAAKAAAQQCMAKLEKRVNDCFDLIKSKNKNVENWELNMVREAGYTVDPLIHRNAIVDVSVIQTTRKRQDVHRYEYFTADSPQFDLDSSGWLGSSEWLVMKKIEEAQKKIQEWSEGIFGSSQAQKSGGRLEEHIGRAPVFVQNIDLSESRERNVKDFGSGQMGRILLDYQWNQIVSTAAASDLSMPIYDQKLMDINGFALPSLRDIVGLVLDIVSNVTGIVALQYADELAFGALDVGLGFKSWENVAESFAKQGLLSGVSKAIKWAASAAGGLLKNTSNFFRSGAGSQILKGAQNAATGYLSGVASNYVEAFDFASGKMDWEAAADSWSDASVLARAAGTFIGDSLGAINNLDANGLVLNSKVFTDIQTLNSSIGSLAGQAFNYIATGDFSVNLLNIKGVGLLEIGVSGGDFKVAIGSGGADLSVQKISALAQGAKNASEVARLKKSGQESQALLNASNLLAWSGASENVALASDLFNKKTALVFESASGASPYGRTQDGAIVLDQNLLSQGKEGQALIAACAAYQNLAQNGAVLESMAKISSVLCSSSAALGVDLAALQEQNSLTVLANAYKQNGMAGVYAIFAETQKEAQKDGTQSASLAQLLEQPWFQNAVQNKDILLGESLAVDCYNEAARLSAIERYAAKKISDYVAANGGSASAEEIKRVGDAARAKASAEILVGEANKEYGYKPESYSLDIKNYGCTLATAAYIAYSITGKISTLSEANQILGQEGMFVYGVDSNGVGQKNLLAAGDNYAKAVNAIAGGDYLQKDGDNCSVNADIKDADEKIIGDNRQKIFDRLLKNSKDQNEVYFSHMRVNDSHSVLFDSMTYTDEKDYKTSTLSVMDPWQGGAYGPKSWSDISRADFYKLTQSGKELYELTRENLRAGSV